MQSALGLHGKGRAAASRKADHAGAARTWQPAGPVLSGQAGLAPLAPPLRRAIAAWNELAASEGLSKVVAATPARCRKLVRRLDECGGIEGWMTVLGKVRASPFLLGRNRARWRANFDFVLQAESFVRILEDAYADGPGVPSPTAWMDEALDHSHSTILDHEP